MTKASLYVKIALYVKVALQKTLPRNKINVAFMVSDSLQYVSESHANLYSTRIFFKNKYAKVILLIVSSHDQDLKKISVSRLYY